MGSVHVYACMFRVGIARQHPKGSVPAHLRQTDCQVAVRLVRFRAATPPRQSLGSLH